MRIGIRTILYTLSFHLCERELCLQKRVKAFIAAAPFPILSVMFRLGLPSCDMIIPRYLALSTTLTAVGGVPGALWKKMSLSLWILMTSHLPRFCRRLNCAATSSMEVAAQFNQRLNRGKCEVIRIHSDKDIFFHSAPGTTPTAVKVVDKAKYLG